MRFENPHPPRRGAFVLIALFSCLQILFGFFLFTGNGQDSALPARNSSQIASYQVASYKDASGLNAVEPASGYEPQKTSLSHSCKGCGTFSYFNEYRAKAREKAAASQHAALKKRMQQKHLQHQSSSTSSKQVRYNPIKYPVISDNESYTASSSN